MFPPALPDRAGRGGLCAEIEAVTKEMIRLTHGADDERLVPPKGEFEALKMRLDGLRERFYRLYGRKVPHG